MNAAGNADTRRQIAAVALLAAVAGGLILLASSRPWLRLSAARPAPFGPLAADVPGRVVYGALPGLAVILLLGAVLLVVSGRVVRSGLAVLLALVSVLAGWYALRGLAAPGASRAAELLGGTAKTQGAPISATVVTAWPIMTLVGASLGLVAGAGLTVLSRRWPPGLSSRFEAPAKAPQADDPWRALDRGDDPTIADR